jgi:predicted ATPase
MIAKLSRLPTETQQALQQFACLGNSATIAMLSNVLESSRPEILALLRPAVEQELIEQLEESCRFMHDRVQEAAYSMIPEVSLAQAHLPRRTAVRGATLVTLQGEREQLAEFNLIAGQRAKASSAYESALTYLATGAELLTDDCWARSHELIFTLVADRGTRPRSVSQRENARRLQRPRRQ